jgi:hypothetical protein
LFFFLFQVSNIWYNHLQKIVKIRTKTPDTPQGIGPLITESSDEKEDILGKY